MDPNGSTAFNSHEARMIFEKVKSCVTKYRLFKPGDSLLLAVSGGPDSMALLTVLSRFSLEWGLKLTVAHVNHQLRRGADVDERFVMSVCSALSLPFVAIKIFIRPIKRKSSLEERSREERMRALIKTAKQKKISIIALGHQQDDLAETILMRIIRGTGLFGIQGILPKRSMGGVTFIRPLIDISRVEIIKYLKSHHVPYRIDPTNRNRSFLRNKIRLDLMPILRKDYQPDLPQVLSNLAKTAAFDYDYLEQRTQIIFERNLLLRNKVLCLPTTIIASQHPAIQRLLIRKIIERTRGHLRQINWQHIEKVLHLTDSLKSKDQLQLPDGMMVQKNNQELAFSLRHSVRK